MAKGFAECFVSNILEQDFELAAPHLEIEP